MVIYSPDGDAYGELAEKIAADRSESLVTDLDVAMNTDDPVLVVSSPSNLLEQELLSLQRRLLSKGPDSGGFSVITGYTPEMAEALYSGRRETNGEDAVVFRNAPERLPDSRNADFLTGNAVTADGIRELTSERLRSFAIQAGGHPIHVTLSDGFICGFPESQRVETYSGTQPFCVRDGERDCPMDEQLVSAESIDAAHVFVMSCASMLNNGTADLPVHVGMGLLNGTESLIGSYRIAASRPHELLLHRSLLAAGYDVNERCYVLNKNSHRNAIEPYPYVAFGAPTARVADPHEPQFTVDVGSEETVRARITDVDAHVVDFRIPVERLPSRREHLYVRNRTDADAPVYYTAFEEDGDARVLVYTGGRMQLDRMELEISAHPSRYIERQIAVESAKSLSRTAETGFLTTKATEQAAQLKNQLRTLPERTVDENFDANAHEDVEQHLNSIHGHVNTIKQELLESTRNTPFLPNHYAKNVVDEDTYVTRDPCTICGERPVFVKQVTGWSGDEKRLLSNCPRCGLVFDVPASEADTAPTYPMIRTDLTADGAREQPLEIEFENPTDAPVQATFQPLILHADNEETTFFEPERRDAILLPGESHVAEFTVDTDLLPHDVYYVSGLVVANLDVYVGYHTAVLGDRAGYYPRKLR